MPWRKEALKISENEKLKRKSWFKMKSKIRYCSEGLNIRKETPSASKNTLRYLF